MCLGGAERYTGWRRGCTRVRVMWKLENSQREEGLQHCAVCVGCLRMCVVLRGLPATETGRQ